MAKHCLLFLLLSAFTLRTTAAAVDFSYDARTSTQVDAIASLPKNCKASPSEIRVSVADPGVLDRLPNTAGLSVDLFLNETLLTNLADSESASISCPKSHIVNSLHHPNLRSVVVASDAGGNDEQLSAGGALSRLPAVLKSVHSSLRSFDLDRKVKASVAFPLSFLASLNRVGQRHQREVLEIFELVKDTESFVIIEADVPGSFSLGSLFPHPASDLAKLAASLVPSTDVPLVLTLKSSVFPCGGEAGGFPETASAFVDEDGVIVEGATGSPARVFHEEKSRQTKVGRSEAAAATFNFFRRALLDGFLIRTVSRDAVPSAPTTATPAPPAVPMVTVPASNPVLTPPSVPTQTAYPPPPSAAIGITTQPPPAATGITTQPPPAATGISPPTSTNQAPPSSGTASPSGSKSACVAKPGASQLALQAALDFACSKTDCSVIQPGGRCYRPNDLSGLASYAMNSYYQKNPSPTRCDFSGVATLVPANQSGCSASSSSPTLVPPSSTGVPGTTSPITSGPATSGSGTPPTVLNAPPGFATASPGPLSDTTSMASKERAHAGWMFMVASLLIAGAQAM